MNVIYIQSNNGYTAKYDCMKNKWTILVKQKLKNAIADKEYNMGKLWVDCDVLKWSLQNGEIKQLDLKDSVLERRWVTVSERIEPKIFVDGNQHKLRVF